MRQNVVTTYVEMNLINDTVSGSLTDKCVLNGQSLIHRLHDGTGVEREAGKADNQHRYCSEMIYTPEVYGEAKTEQKSAYCKKTGRSSI